MSRTSKVTALWVQATGGPMSEAVVLFERRRLLRWPQRVEARGAGAVWFYVKSERRCPRWLCRWLNGVWSEWLANKRAEHRADVQRFVGQRLSATAIRLSSFVPYTGGRYE